METVRGTQVEGFEGTGSDAPLLAGFLLAWREKTPYAKDNDFVFPSTRLKGKKPLTMATAAALRRLVKWTGAWVARRRTNTGEVLAVTRGGVLRL